MTKEFIKRRKMLKDGITEKYGTQSQFCRLAGVNRMELQILFAVKYPDLKFLKRVESLAGSVKPKPTHEVLEPAKLEALKRAINASGGVGPFCKEHTQFSRHTVNQIVAGRYGTVSRKVKELLKHFGI